MQAPNPSEIRVSKDKKLLTVTFPELGKFEFTAEMLRVFSPSAEVQGHSPDQRKLVGGKKNVAIMQIEPIGNYAIRITFDDMHDTGIYSWAWFSENGPDMEQHFQSYQKELSAAGLSR